ncbi:helix-turn-helix domain-containing protein [Aerosakkonemataceae cyanobacterium BLCC-F154]|uniref:Helix-turn-helix domain-containing protein n=1 Tax=Floridaenema fluviatile BLCC-F154 TaxID=3153640 RepID=A0ABV4Y7I4_9CYAN
MRQEAKRQAELIQELAAMRQSIMENNQSSPLIANLQSQLNRITTELSTIAQSANTNHNDPNLNGLIQHLTTTLQSCYNLVAEINNSEPLSSDKNSVTNLADRPNPTQFQFPNNSQLREIFAFIEANYQKPIGLNEIAKSFGYSPSYLTSLVRRLTGQTVYQWIVERRMFQARHLLLETDLAVRQIAKAVGYIDTGHFVKHFRQLHQHPPNTWREMQRFPNKNSAIDRLFKDEQFDYTALTVAL